MNLLNKTNNLSNWLLATAQHRACQLAAVLGALIIVVVAVSNAQPNRDAASTDIKLNDPADVLIGANPSGMNAARQTFLFSDLFKQAHAPIVPFESNWQKGRNQHETFGPWRPLNELSNASPDGQHGLMNIRGTFVTEVVNGQFWMPSGDYTLIYERKGDARLDMQRGVNAANLLRTVGVQRVQFRGERVEKLSDGQAERVEATFRIIFENNPDTRVNLRINAIGNAGSNFIRKVQFILPGEYIDGQATFNPKVFRARYPYLFKDINQDGQPDGVIRVMDLKRMKDTTRDTLDSHGPITGSFAVNDTGVPLDYLIDWSNETGLRLWLELPVGVDDQEVENVAGSLTRLRRPPIVGYMNEFWNFAFRQQFRKLRQLAMKRNPQDRNGWIFHAQRTYEIEQIMAKHAPKVEVALETWVLPQFKDHLRHYMNVANRPPQAIAFTTYTSLGDVREYAGQELTLDWVYERVDTTTAEYIQRARDHRAYLQRLTNGQTKMYAYEGGAGVAVVVNPKLGEIVDKHLVAEYYASDYEEQMLEHWEGIAPYHDLICDFTLGALPRGFWRHWTDGTYWNRVDPEYAAMCKIHGIDPYALQDRLNDAIPPLSD